MLTKEQLVDRRILERNLHRGLLTEADHKKYLASLKDVANQATFVDYVAQHESDAASED